MARKKPTVVTRLNLMQLNIGWFHRGKPFIPCHAKNAANAAKSTVSSNMIGKNAGTVKKFQGFPCTSRGYRNEDGPNSTTAAVRRPETPPNKTHPLNHDLPRPIASSIPWMGKGEKTSQRRKPASRTRLAAS